MRSEVVPAGTGFVHVVYALHAFAILTGILTAATVIGSFVASAPSLIGVLLNYATRGGVRGTWVESHYRWQIRTFWFALLWLMSATAVGLTIIGLPIALLMLGGLGVWLTYRIARGWIRLASQRPMYI